MNMRKPLALGGIAALGLGALAVLFPPFEGARPIASADQATFDQARQAFAAQLAGGADERLLSLAGFQASTLAKAPETTLLSEPEGECAGRGIYWMRDEGASLALTAPHRGSDRHTGTLAATLFLETGALAAAWNSAPRRATDACPNAIDLAREEMHAFTAFALAFADRNPRGLMVQLHGFDGKRREGLAAQNAAMILSDGTDAPSARVLDLADCLSLAFAPDEVLVYPLQTSELGALTNAQGRVLRREGFGGFVHLEMSADMRAALVANDLLRGKLGACLMEASA